MGSKNSYLIKVNIMSQSTYAQPTCLVSASKPDNFAETEARLRKNMIDGWVSLFIVNIILNIIFPNAWWVFIPVVVLFAKAIEKSIAFAEFKNKKSAKEQTFLTSAPKATVIVSQVEKVAPANGDDEIRYCAACGTAIDAKTKFCTMCGMQIR